MTSSAVSTGRLWFSAGGKSIGELPVKMPIVHCRPVSMNGTPRVLPIQMPASNPTNREMAATAKRAMGLRLTRRLRWEMLGKRAAGPQSCVIA